MATTIPAAPTAPTEPGAALTHRVESGREQRSERLLVWLFLIPTVGGLALFTLVPIVASFLLAFFEWDIISSPKWVGLNNFGDIAADATVRRSFLNTIGFVIVAVALQLGIALWLATLVQSRLPSWLQGVFRSAFFFPLVLSAASVSLVMAYLFNADFGLVNGILNAFGIADVQWLSTGIGGHGGRDPRLRLAELRVLVPAVRRRPGLDPEGDLRGLRTRWRQGLGAHSARSRCRSSARRCWWPP